MQATAKSIEIVDVIALGNALEVDRDHAITMAPIGEVLVIRLAPGAAYPDEVHEKATETILALSGQFSILAGDARYDIAAGQCCRIPPGLAHRWGPRSDAVVLVHFGTPVR